MRSFEERKAEVFRRSENRIKERRKARSRALTVCIPLCLIITVWSCNGFAGNAACKQQEIRCNG